LYLDPPFFRKAEHLYRFWFGASDHVKLRDALLEMEHSWLLSYDSAEQIELLYGESIRKAVNGTQRKHVELLYSTATISTRKRATEVLISNLEVLPRFDAGSPDGL